LVHNNAIYIGPGPDVQAVLLTDWSGWAKGLEFRDNLFYSEGIARYGHQTSRTNGTYGIGPGWGPAQEVVFRNNSYVGQHENRPTDEGVQSSTAPKPISFDDWPGPHFDPRKPEDFGRFIKVHRAWMERLMKRQFGKAAVKR
jgi:hypothetical protein